MPSKDKPNILFILADDLGWGMSAITAHPFARQPSTDSPNRAFSSMGTTSAQCVHRPVFRF